MIRKLTPYGLEIGEKLLWKYEATRHISDSSIDPNIFIYIKVKQKIESDLGGEAKLRMAKAKAGTQIKTFFRPS